MESGFITRLGEVGFGAGGERVPGGVSSGSDSVATRVCGACAIRVRRIPWINYGDAKDELHKIK